MNILDLQPNHSIIPILKQFIHDFKLNFGPLQRSNLSIFILNYKCIRIFENYQEKNIKSWSEFLFCPALVFKQPFDFDSSHSYPKRRVFLALG